MIELMIHELYCIIIKIITEAWNISLCM